MSNETYKQQTADSDMIFAQVTSGGFDNFEDANRLVCMLYVPDSTVSRAGISHALKRLEKHYASPPNAEVERRRSRPPRTHC